MQPSRKRARKSSPVWDFMEKISETCVKCKICNSNFTYKGTTSNMRNHLVAKHPMQFLSSRQEEETAVDTPEQVSSSIPNFQPQQQTLHAIVARNDGYKEGGAKKTILDDHLVDLITIDMQPLSIVDDMGFRKFVHALDPRYILPSRRDLTRRLLPAKYEDAVNNLKKDLEDTPWVSLTTDIWTSRGTKGYITVTAHYVSDDWILKSAVLETPRLCKDHTAANIADELTRICKD